MGASALLYDIHSDSPAGDDNGTRKPKLNHEMELEPVWVDHAETGEEGTDGKEN